ncbi:MAG: D-alanyl-D-alanine carboxypeptidase/D-alanyl-D-alanine-endopeptidase [Bacteroidota bacterium]|nr:D-alanyl-D-alanine carboxypeptidase/D-alanyl-D-alanine-endopeptidase [Bacteroidota bacterium]
MDTKYLVKYLLPFWFFFTTCVAAYQISDSLITDNTPKSLKTQIDNILKDSLLDQCFFGIKIISLDDGRVLYELNSNKLFHPASNMKLLTTATAINTLKHGYQFKTKLFTDGKVVDSVLRENLYIIGSGDPLLETNDLDSLSLLLNIQGIKKIRGDIAGDVSRFDSIYWGKGWMWDDEPESYSAFITPLTVNGNSIKIFVSPGKNIGDPPSIKTEPVTSFTKLFNFGITSNDTLIPLCQVTRQRGTNNIIINGRLSPADEIKEFKLSIWKPELYFLSLLKERLKLSGIIVDRDITLDSIRHWRKESIFLAEVSHPIDSVLHQINKNSDNLAAENLLKTISAEHLGSSGSAENGLLLIKNYLASEGIDTSKMILVDGSGVSWYNAISPDAIVQILQKQYERKTTFKRFYESLAIAGVDGTLKNRMKGTRAEGNVHAKTGSLLGVSNLSGYVKSADGKLLAFSILCNHFPGESKILKEMQDKVIELLSKLKLNR